MLASFFRALDVWQRSMALVEECYRTTRSFPDDERFGLTSQIRRAAVSIPSNVAEGRCRKSTATYANHVDIALGSHGELETLIEVACRLGYLTKTAGEPLISSCQAVGQMLTRLHQSLELKIRTNPRR
jgi:four helix bundle protein